MSRFFLVGVVLFLSSAEVGAQSDADREKAFKLLSSYVELACPQISLDTEVEKRRAEVDAKVALPGIIKKLVNLNFGGAAAYETEKAKGPLREHLAALQKDLYGCRYNITKLIITDVLRERGVALPPDKTVLSENISRSFPKKMIRIENLQSREIKAGPILRIFYKNNLTPQHLVLLARRLPTFDVRPGRSAVDPIYSADTLFVNRDKVDKSEVVKVLNALHDIGVSIKSIQQMPLGGMREVQVGAIIGDTKGLTEFASARVLDIPKLTRSTDTEFWQQGFNGRVFCDGGTHTSYECSMDENARPVPE